MSVYYQKLAKSVLDSLGFGKPARLLYKWLALWKYRAVDRFEVNINNIKVFFSTEDPYSKHWFFPRYNGGKIHEKKVTELLLEALRGSKCFVDVGANLGWYTCLACKHMPDGIVYAFEMDDLNYSILRYNVEINNCHNAKTYHLAVTDASGFASYARNSKDPSPYFRLLSDERDKESENIVSIEAITLDELFTDEKVMPNVIKIDVEGAETRVLNGMKRLMRDGEARLFVEVHPYTLPYFKSSAEEVIMVLIDNGYDVFEIQQMRDFSVSERFRKLDKTTELRDTTMLYAYKTSHYHAL
jgi:FkbM family methyltransferase